MKKVFINLVFAATFLVAGTANSQIVNVNPDPSGPLWIAGDAILAPPEIEASTPVMTLSPASALTDLPTVIDNSQHIFMPPVYDQGGSAACVQVAEIWYSFAYEVNRLRNASAGDTIGDTNYWQNQYHPFYTYNYLNDADGQSTTSYKSGYEIIMENGCPSYKVYDDFALHSNNDNKYKYWMNEFDHYEKGMHNKISGYENIVWDSSYSSLDLLKHWVSDHNSEDTTGGLAVISVFIGETPNTWITYYAFPPGSPEGGMHYVSQWGLTKGHALTIVGYNDSVQCFDLDTNGQYANVDIDGDSVVELDECELGAFKVVNSWGDWRDNGYIYVPYKLMSEGLQVNKRAYVCHPIEENTPELLVKSSVEYPAREEIAYRVGYAENADSISTTLNTSFNCFSFQGGNNEMRGAYSGPLESALDFGYKYGEKDIGKIFFIILDHDMDSLNSLCKKTHNHLDINTILFKTCLNLGYYFLCISIKMRIFNLLIVIDSSI